jgi:carbonic anhydrase/acetyltransferase-like protein (isoleucine patch superfamily)
MQLMTRTPRNLFLAHNATVAGEVEAGELTSFWFNVVVRGDVAKVTIGRRVNVRCP